MRKKAIVTGASRGIGRGIIRELAAAGYDIAFSYRTREDEAKEAAEEIRNMGSFAWYAKADMAQAGEGEKFFDQAVRELGGLDLLVNNAGVTVFQSILDLEMEETQKMLNLDLLNYLVLSSKAARYMKAHEVKGCIINITSSRARKSISGRLCLRRHKGSSEPGFTVYGTGSCTIWDPCELCGSGSYLYPYARGNKSRRQDRAGRLLGKSGRKNSNGQKWNTQRYRKSGSIPCK